MPRSDVRYIGSTAGPHSIDAIDSRYRRQHSRKAGRARRVALLGYTEADISFALIADARSDADHDARGGMSGHLDFVSLP